MTTHSHGVRDARLRAMQQEASLPPDPPLTNTKGFWRSKTFWANLAVVLVGIGQVFQGDSATAGIGAIIVGIGNILLRWTTTVPMEFATSEKALTP